jgi:hypothetical protein
MQAVITDVGGLDEKSTDIVAAMLRGILGLEISDMAEQHRVVRNLAAEALAVISEQ